MSERLITTEASALLAWHLAHGEAVGYGEAVEITGLTVEGARQMLNALAEVLYIETVPGAAPILWERRRRPSLKMLRRKPRTVRERAAALAWLLADGRALSNVQAAEATGLVGDSARQMLCRVSRVLPVLCYRGRWMVAELLESDQDGEEEKGG